MSAGEDTRNYTDGPTTERLLDVLIDDLAKDDFSDRWCTTRIGGNTYVYIQAESSYCEGEPNDHIGHFFIVDCNGARVGGRMSSQAQVSEVGSVEFCTSLIAFMESGKDLGIIELMTNAHSHDSSIPVYVRSLKTPQNDTVLAILNADQTPENIRQIPRF